MKLKLWVLEVLRAWLAEVEGVSVGVNDADRLLEGLQLGVKDGGEQDPEWVGVWVGVSVREVDLEGKDKLKVLLTLLVREWEREEVRTLDLLRDQVSVGVRLVDPDKVGEQLGVTEVKVGVVV